MDTATDNKDVDDDRNSHNLFLVASLSNQLSTLIKKEALIVSEMKAITAECREVNPRLLKAYIDGVSNWEQVHKELSLQFDAIDGSEENLVPLIYWMYDSIDALHMRAGRNKQFLDRSEAFPSSVKEVAGDYVYWLSSKGFPRVEPKRKVVTLCLESLLMRTQESRSSTEPEGVPLNEGGKKSGKNGRKKHCSLS